MPEYSENLKQMVSQPARKPVVESKQGGIGVSVGKSLRTLLNTTKDTFSTLKEVYTDILTKPGGGRWGEHAVTDNLIPNVIEGKGLEGDKRRDVQAYMGGYDFVSKYPESREGARVLAYAHQTRDIVTKGGVAFLGKGLLGFIKTAQGEIAGYKGNVKGIEAAQQDLKKGELKKADSLGHPSKELVEQAIRSTE